MSNVLYEEYIPGGDLLIQFVGRDAYKQFWNFSKDEKENLATQLAIELPHSEESWCITRRNCFGCWYFDKLIVPTKNRILIPWSLYLALLFYLITFQVHII